MRVAGTSQPPRWLPGQPLPGAERAIIPPEKLHQYALNPAHPRGAAKAVIFARLLGYTQDNWEELRDAVLASLPSAPAQYRGTSAYGISFTVDVRVRGPGGRVATVRTGWIIRDAEEVPRLTSIYVLRRAGGRLSSSEVGQAMGKTAAARQRPTAERPSGPSDARRTARAAAPALLDVVTLKEALPDHGLGAGAEGTVVETFTHPEAAYLVEFTNDRGETIAEAPFRADQVVVVWRLGRWRAAQRARAAAARSSS